MYKGKRILGVIPARAASKRLPGKNARPFAGKPLIAWTIEAARDCSLLDDTVLSSDDEGLIVLARALGCRVPFKRAAHLATDEATTVDVVLDVLARVAGPFDYVVILQPTSPLRRARDIEAAIRRCVDTAASACISVAPPPKPLNFYGALSADGALQRGAIAPPDNGIAVVINGAVYVVDVPTLLRERAMPTVGVVAYEMDVQSSFDIDEAWEFAAAEAIAKTVLI